MLHKASVSTGRDLFVWGLVFEYNFSETPELPFHSLAPVYSSISLLGHYLEKSDIRYFFMAAAVVLLRH
jgi:hypothetical protein